MQLKVKTSQDIEYMIKISFNQVCEEHKQKLQTILYDYQNSIISYQDKHIYFFIFGQHMSLWMALFFVFLHV